VSGPDLVVVGASWGGPAAVQGLLAALPEELEAAVVVVQHRGATSLKGGLASFLSRASPLPVVEPEDKEPVEHGRVYLAPAGYHLLVDAAGFALSTDEPVGYARPSIDVLFESAADVYGERVVGIVLTGSNDDGARGLARIKELGGVAVVQEPATAERREMPDAAIEAAQPDAVLPLDEIAPFLAQLVAHGVNGRVGGRA
jgi:two-component system chemotaxis response regulator CheB